MANWRISDEYPKNWWFRHFLEVVRPFVQRGRTGRETVPPSVILIAMQVSLIYIGPRPAAKNEFEALTADYLQRSSSFARCSGLAFRSEEAMLDWLDKQRGRTAAIAVFCDSQGRQMSSEAFAKWLGSRRDDAAQHLVFAVGPHDGWSETARKRADLLLSLGALTLPHMLARLILAEQLYRAFTILAGHPYHCGH
jgi:23S rRNA (pseudouridine1915-N3)-methyltransferase